MLEIGTSGTVGEGGNILTYSAVADFNHRKVLRPKVVVSVAKSREDDPGRYGRKR
jgi:hypothetical protein